MAIRGLATWWRALLQRREKQRGAGRLEDVVEQSPWLIAGLGNPGPEYAGHRHNVGYLVADVLAARIGVRFSRHRRAAALVAEGRLGPGGPRLVLVKPTTYMNLSGGPVAGLARFYKVALEQVVAVHDELDIPFSQLRLKRGGGAGGHNGIRSLIGPLGPDFIRVRFGIGRPPGRQDPAVFVLSDFSAVERKELEFLVDRAADAVEMIVRQGLEPAQNVYHAD